MLTIVLLALPWIAAAVVVPPLLGRGPRLRDHAPGPLEGMPVVSVVVPARNEAINIGACLASLLNGTYARAGLCEVIVVDDESTDGTGELARALAERSGGTLRVVRGEPLPDGWIGKSWACWQGYRAAGGELLLFTDADTQHAPELLAHAVSALLERRADLLTLIPRQVMGTFWERLVMPHILGVILLRFLDLGRVARTRKPRDAIANGQFLLFRRQAYESIGGHEAVRGEIVEDLRLAQELTAAGRAVFIAFAEDLMATRMYRSLRQLVEGWTKNLALGARAVGAGSLGAALPYLIAGLLLLFWAAPPLALLLGLLAGAGASTLYWAALATGASLLFWMAVNRMLGAPAQYAALYPLGAAFAAALFALSAARGQRVRWRGRLYGETARGREP